MAGRGVVVVVVEGGQAGLVLAADAGEQLVPAGDEAGVVLLDLHRLLHRQADEPHGQTGQRLGQLARLVEDGGGESGGGADDFGDLTGHGHTLPHEVRRRHPLWADAPGPCGVVACCHGPRRAREPRGQAVRTYDGCMADQRGRVLLADPRGYCAGVDRAVIAVERALEIHGAPVYVRKQIVHNKHVVATLERRGAIFVDETDEVPEGSVVVFSAHGVSPAVHQEAADRQLRTIDATCPLVTQGAQEAKRFAQDDYDILLIGHRGHEEVEGTVG